MRGTIFNDLDEDKLRVHIDFDDFEERFKIGTTAAVRNGDAHDGGNSINSSKRFKKQENVTVMEHTRLRNIGGNESQF